MSIETTDPGVIEGTLDGLDARLSSDGSARVEHELCIGDARVALLPLVDRPMVIEFTGKIVCRQCGALTARSYGDGHCYPCFKRLARCDLCVVSPDRCHYHLGTCREPAWGAAFCMYPHVVYLANSAGLKVGITREGNLPGRWLEQGAGQGVVVMRTRTRHQAGCLEAALRGFVGDRTDVRLLLQGDARDLDLVAEWSRLRMAAAKPIANVVREFGSDVADELALHVQRFDYPVKHYPDEAHRFKLDRSTRVAGRLAGAKGSYLLFDTGVFNVREHTSYHVRLTTPDRLADIARPRQMRLF